MFGDAPNKIGFVCGIDAFVHRREQNYSKRKREIESHFCYPYLPFFCKLISESFYKERSWGNKFNWQRAYVMKVIVEDKSKVQYWQFWREV